MSEKLHQTQWERQKREILQETEQKLESRQDRSPWGSGVPVVGRWEHGDALPWVGDLVAFALDLVAAHDVVQLVLLQEALRHVRPELAAHAPLTDGAAVLQEEEEEDKAGLFNTNHSYGSVRKCFTNEQIQ